MKHCLAETLITVAAVALVAAGLLVAGFTLVDRIALARVVTYPAPAAAHYAVSAWEVIPYDEPASRIELPMPAEPTPYLPADTDHALCCAQ